MSEDAAATDVARSAAADLAPIAVAGCRPAARPDLVDAALGGRLRAIVEPPDSFCYSAFAAFEHCPLNYALKYVCGLEPPEPVPAFAFGRAAHRAFELFTRARRERAAAGEEPPGRADLDRWFDEAWAEVGFPDEATAAAWLVRVAPMLDRFWDTEQRRPAETIGEEEEFGFELDLEDGSRVALTGIIDRLDRRPDGTLELVDYKTGPAWAPGSNYDLQLALYALACRDALGLGPPDRALVYFVEHSLFAVRPVPAARLDAVRADAERRAAAIRASDFAPTPGPKTCRWCDFREVCPAAAPASMSTRINPRGTPPPAPEPVPSPAPRGAAAPRGS